MIDFVRTCFKVSIRRACRAVPACRGTYHYLCVPKTPSELLM